MTKVLTHWLMMAVLLSAARPVLAGDDDSAGGLERVKSAAFLAPGSGANPLNYAPDRDLTPLHLALDVTPDFHHRTVAGTATWKFQPTVKPARELKLDAVDLSVESVTATEKIQAWQLSEDHLIVTFARPIPAGQAVSVTITYHAQPELGLYFRTPEMGYKEGDAHCFSQGEEVEARHWFPCFDSPNEKFTSEVTCRVPAGMTAISNGRLVSEVVDAATGLTAIHWSQDQPHSTYLITLAAGYFKKLEGHHGEVPLAFLTPPSEFAQAPNSFRETDEIMGFFEGEIGVPFPWAKYDQVCVNDFVAGGMENTSATTLTDSTLFTSQMENIRNSQSLISHEMAHQWFGDLVTCKDWSHIWLNEGFATYYQVLYDGWKNGRDALLYDLYENARQVIADSNDTNAIVRRNYDDPQEMFGNLAYEKGGWVLHMLRSELGADLYRRCIKTYLERHRYGNVTTEDLRAVIEELSGRSFDQFFDQWLYHAHYPELEADYSWDEMTKLAKVSIRQTQDTANNVLIFDVPLTIRFKGSFGTVDRVVEVKDAASDFYFPLESEPDLVRLDPDYTLLAKTDFKVPNGMLFAQLDDQTDVVGRLLAIEQLADHHDLATVAKLGQTLNQDGFYGVRVEAARTLRAIHTDEALAALLDATNEPDARVRRSVVSAIGGFYRDTACARLRTVLATETNPTIEAEAIRNLGPYPQTEIHDLLVKYLKSESFREELAGAAISAIRTQEDSSYLPALMSTLKERQNEIPTRAFSMGLATVASLAHHEEDKSAARKFLIEHVNDPKESVRHAAIAALGVLGDPQAIAVLSTFATAEKDSPERVAAEQAIATLRSDRKSPDDLRQLRTEVMDLQKSTRELRRQLDDLKKQLKALGGGPAGGVKDSPVHHRDHPPNASGGGAS